MRAGDLAGRRILIVEDESMIVMLLEDQVEELACVVAGPAASVSGALECLNSGPIDAAILDVNLRGETSYALADALAERGTPYIFITGYGAVGLDPKYKNQPVLQKPFTSMALQHALSRLFDSNPVP